jgi:Bacterial SH3 domain
MNRAILAVIVSLAAAPGPLRAQEATSNRNANLRRDPTTSSPVITLLQKGSRLTLVDDSPDSGFYHVRTEDDQVGWVFARLLSLAPAGPPPPPETAGGAAPEGAPTAAASCDSSLWSHVYHSGRLLVKNSCLAVTGTIVDATAGKRSDGVRHEADGDTHGWLQVDAAYTGLLNAGNKSDEGGNLVFEVVCRFPVTQVDAKKACQGYTDTIQLPLVGSHVRIVGSYVQDTFHAKWNEIHPVSSIAVIP